MNKKNISKYLAILLFPSILILFGACTTKFEKQGHLLSKKVVESIKVGFDNKTTVLNKLGSASTVDAFDNQTWIYISRTTEQKPFYKPKTIDQKTFAITFDESGIVKSIRDLNFEDRKLINHQLRETKSSGIKSSILKDLFRNIGKVTPAMNN